MHQPFYLKMDIKSFFTSIDQQILYNLIVKRVKNEEILWLAHTIISHDCARDVPPKIQSCPSLFDKLPVDKSLFTAPKGKGLPIGNLTSQFFANVYLNELDQFVKHHLKAKYYLRYVDDFLMLDDSEQKLAEWQGKITQFAQEKLGLAVHPLKCFIRPVASGIDFVGYVVRPEYVLIRNRVAGDWRRKMDRTKGDERRQTYNSYQAHAIWANAFWFSRKMAGKIATI